MASKEKKGRGVGFWEMIRDICVTSINKGQFPAVGLVLVILTILWRLPPEDLSVIVFNMIEALKTRYVWGYALSGVLTIGWYFNTRNLRRVHSNEMKRIGDEKTSLQEKVLGPGKITHSRRG